MMVNQSCGITYESGSYNALTYHFPTRHFKVGNINRPKKIAQVLGYPGGVENM